MLPQFLPCAAQVVGSHAQTLGAPPAPHFFPEGQLPQGSVPPHSSGMLPQSLPWAAQLVGRHPHLLGWLFTPQALGEAQVPQSRVLPQPSPIRPHSAPAAAQVDGVQVPTPQTLGPPAPQFSPVGQLPH